MRDYSPSAYRGRFMPESVREAGEITGRRAVVELVLSRIDPDDPAIGSVTSILSDMVKAGVELDERAVETALKLARLEAEPSRATQIRTSRALAALPMYGPKADADSIVYYVRRGSLIKIGTTTQPRKRFSDLLPDAVLAFEPGDQKVESVRHLQFESLRRGREYFEPRRPLLAHIKRMLSQHGEPDSSWLVTMETLGQGTRGLSTPLARPASGEALSAVEISRRLKVSFSMVRAWTHRGHLKPVAGGTRRRPLYFLDQARELAERSRELNGRNAPSEAEQATIFDE